MGLPLALLIIGAKLSEGKVGGNWLQHSTLAAIKLLIQPGLGLILLRFLDAGDLPTAVTVLLLASPTATISVILADQMGGDARLASEAVTVSHAGAALSYTLWLWWLVG
jgi:malate permease and related proteins